MSAPSGLDPAAIERDLREMWRAAGAEAPERPLVRAALVNCIFIAPGTASEVATTVTRVSAVVPCRALVVECAPAALAGALPLEAWTSMHCRAYAGREQVCCEQVTVRVRPEALDGLAPALLALLLPDLPTVLVVPARAAFVGSVLERLVPHVDRLVVDSAGFGDADDQLARLEAWRVHGAEVADLNWGRLDAWRELFASFFDAAPFDASLHALAEVRITHPPAARAQALLLAGWIASRLGWRLEGKSGDRAAYIAGRHTVELRLVPAAPAADRSGLRRLAARAAGGIDFVIEPDAAHPSLLVGRVEGAACPAPRRLEDRTIDADAELVHLLQRAHRNPAYAEALGAATRLAAAPA